MNEIDCNLRRGYRISSQCLPTTMRLYIDGNLYFNKV
jgi:hypothetical protein